MVRPLITKNLPISGQMFAFDTMMSADHPVRVSQQRSECEGRRAIPSSFP
jgi:hypothetical protein